MANSSNLDLQLKISADDQASSKLDGLNVAVEKLQAQIVALQAETEKGGKDWADYATQAAAAGESASSIVVNLEDAAIKLGEITVALTVYSRWRSLVDSVKTGYEALQGAIESATVAGKTVAGSAWNEITSSATRLEVKLADLTASFNGFRTISAGLEVGGLVLALAAVGTKAAESNEQVRAMTEQVGGLGKALQDLDPASKPVQIAKERYEELYKASLQLKQSTEDLVDPYKRFFDAVQGSNLTVQQAGRTFTDLNQVYQSLRASSAETAEAQNQLADAFDKGVTTVPKLGAIFGATLNPAMEAVAKQMGITREELGRLIDTGQVGADRVIPALAAAARTVSQPLQSAGDAATFAADQFKAMGISAYDLSNQTLPGVANAVDRTGKAIAATIDGSVDPIGAAVEQIQLFGQKIVDWATLTKQSIVEAVQGPDIAAAFKTGLQEAVFGLDYLLVGLREEISAVGQSMGILAASAVTATNPLDDLSAVWSGMNENLIATRDHLNEYVNALEGVDNATGRTAEGAKALTESLKTLPEIKLPAEIQDIVNKLDGLKNSSQSVAAVWKELGTLDFTGNNIRNLLVLRQTIEDVSAKTKDAEGTQAAFSKQLSELPIAQLSALVAKVTELAPRLKEAGDEGALLKTALGAVFQKLNLDAAEAGKSVTETGKQAAEAFRLLATSAETTGAQVRAALSAALDSAKTQADVNLIKTQFDELARSGQASAKLIADGNLEIAKRLEELLPKISPVENAFRDLGVKSAASLQAAADTAATAFNDLKENGAAAGAVLQDAFLRWADAALKAAQASDLPVPAIVRNQAAALGLTGALQSLIDKYPRLNLEQEANVQLADKNASAARGYVSSLEAVASAQINGIRQQIALAQAMGDTEDAQQKSIELAKLEAQWQQTIAAAKLFAIEAEKKEVEAKIASLTATQQNTQAVQLEIAGLQLRLQALGKQQEAEKLLIQLQEQRLKLQGLQVGEGQQQIQGIQQNTTAVDQNTAALNKNAKEAEAAAGGAKSFYAVIAQVRAEVAALSEQALDALDRKMTNLTQDLSASGFRDLADDVGIASAEIQDLTQHVEDAQAAFRYNASNALFASGLGQFLDELKAAQAEVIATYYQQKLAVEQVKESLDAMTQAGAVDMGTLKLATEAANGSFNLLKEQDLTELRASIDKANESLRKMQEEAQTAQDRIAELNAEIAKEKGDTATSERLRLELEQRQALAEVEANLAKARNEQNQELIRLYEEQKRKLQELYDLKERNLEQEQRQAKAEASKNATDSGSSSTTTTTTTATKPTTTPGGGGIVVNVNAPNASYLDPKAANDLARAIKPALDDLNRRLA